MDQPLSGISNAGTHDSIMNTLAKLESTVSSWSQTIEQTRQKIEAIAELGSKSKDEFTQMKNALAPHLSDLQSVSRVVTERIRANPRPVALAFAGLIGGLLFWSYSQNRAIPTVNHAQIH